MVVLYNTIKEVIIVSLYQSTTVVDNPDNPKNGPYRRYP